MSVQRSKCSFTTAYDVHCPPNAISTLPFGVHFTMKPGRQIETERLKLATKQRVEVVSQILFPSDIDYESNALLNHLPDAA